MPEWGMTVISISSADGAEGRAGSFGTLRFVVSLSAPAAQVVTVDYATADSAKAKALATAGTDYVSTSGTLRFEIGQVARYVDVRVIGDGSVEGDEGFDLVLSNALGATLGKDASLTASGTIKDDEPTLAVAAAKIDEGAAKTGGSSGKLLFAVSLADFAPQDVRVDYATSDGTKDPATAGSDYTAASGTLTIPTGKKLGYIAVPVLDDTTVEKAETLILTLSNPIGASFGKSTALTATGTIDDDEAASGGSGTLSLSTTSSYEGDVLYFSVSLSAPASQVVTAKYAVAATKLKAKTGLAKKGLDFDSDSGILTFSPGETVHTIAVRTHDDERYEGTETFDVVLSNAKGASLSGGGTTLKATGTILDDEPLITASAASLYEPIAPTNGSAPVDNAALMRFAVTLAHPTDHTVTVAYAAAKTKTTDSKGVAVKSDTAATPGRDFDNISGTLTFAPGEVQAYAQVMIYDDALVEKSETFNLTLSRPEGAAFADFAKSITVVGTILDNEPTLSI
ncbi:hypothetical protein MASR1M60_01870 [Rhodocyclaceae bacterium]